MDEPRPGAPRTISDEQVEAVIVATLERTPKEATHWSRASMAAESGLSRSTIGRIWREFRLNPHLVTGNDLSRHRPGNGTFSAYDRAAGRLGCSRAGDR